MSYPDLPDPPNPYPVHRHRDPTTGDTTASQCDPTTGITHFWIELGPPDHRTEHVPNPGWLLPGEDVPGEEGVTGGQ